MDPRDRRGLRIRDGRRGGRRRDPRPSERTLRLSRNVFGAVCVALGLPSAVAFSASCGMQELPPRAPVPSPDGGVAFRCPGSPAAARSDLPSAIALTADLAHWSDRTGCFAGRPAIVSTSVRAADVDPGWSEAQKRLLSRREKPHASSLVAIGGDYWQGTPYPVAPRGAAPWVSSAFEADPSADLLPHRTGEAPTGTMASKAFAIEGRALGFAIGGSDDAAVGVELLVAPDGRDLSRCEGSTGAVVGGPAVPPGFVRVATRRRGANPDAPERDHLERTSFVLDAPGCRLDGLQAIVRIVDASKTAHVNVGGFAVEGEASSPPPPLPVWGFADFHTHPTDTLGFGGLQGVHTIWGAPGGAMREYVDDSIESPRSFARDVPPCDDPHMPFNAHHGGFSAPAMINGAEGRLTPSIADLDVPAVAALHPSQGGPTYADFPDFRSGAHEQYHVSQIHRAYLGGLRLMTALAVHNPGLEYGMGWVRCGENGAATVDTTDDWAVIKAHVRAMRQLAQLNDDWMEIAYSPAQARRIIAKNKLAVILGVEMPRLGRAEDGDPALQVEALEALGVRQVILIHGMDNLLAGSAIFQDLYNTVTDWIYRPDQDKVLTLSGSFYWGQFPASFFDITTSADPVVSVGPGGAPGDDRDRILFRLSNPERIVLSDVYPRPGPTTYQLGPIPFGPLHTLVNTTPIFKTAEGQYDEYGAGHRNARGLTGRGKEFLQRLMQHGMVVDVAHMSDQSLADAYRVTDEACGAYPMMVSHAHFRRLALRTDYSDRAADFVARTSAAVLGDIKAGKPPMSACIQDRSRCDPAVLADALLTAHEAPDLGPGTANRENLAREFDIASSEVDEVRRRHGAVGVFIGEGPMDAAAYRPAYDLPGGLARLPFADDCAGSSKNTAAALLYGAAHLGPEAALGLASDFTLVGNTAPRFGPDACAAYLGSGSSSASGAQLLETLLDPGHYRFADQKDAVVYASGSTFCTAGSAASREHPCGSNEPLEPYAMGARTYDFNVDGLAHYGLVPDLLQDSANVLGSSKDLVFDPVFRSAEGYIAMWESARALSACEESGKCAKAATFPEDPQCQGQEVYRPECGSSCPCSWNRGAPLQEVAQRDSACDPGSPIRFPLVDDRGERGSVPAIYDQHGADPGAAAEDIREQGDWGIYPIRSGQLWQCGDRKPAPLSCPAAANYVKVRRVLDTTVGPLTERCDALPLPPEDGNRHVVFQCLVGPPAAGSPKAKHGRGPAR